MQSAAMVAKKLLVDDKITACFKGICKVLNRKTLSGSSLVKHFALLKIFKFCASSSLLFFFFRAADWPTTNFVEILLFFCNPNGKLCLSSPHYKGKIHPLEFFWESFSKSWKFLENSRRNSCYCAAGYIQIWYKKLITPLSSSTRLRRSFLWTTDRHGPSCAF